MYKKRLTAGMKNLTYLDDRPVFEIERIAADAWLIGGIEAEKEVRLAF
jgi:dynein assembly factor 1